MADPDPYYLPETTSTVAHIIRDFLLPMIKTGMTMEEIETEFRRVKGNPMAKATVENALLVLIAEHQGIPLHTLLGYPSIRVMSGISIGIKDTVEDLLGAVQEAVDKKYHRVKMKIKRGKDVAWVRAVRERFPAVPLMVDANCDFTLEDRGLLQKLDAFGLTMIEQPLSYADIYQHSLAAEGSEDAALSGRIHPLSGRCADGPGPRVVPHHQYQTGTGGRIDRVDAHRGTVP